MDCVGNKNTPKQKADPVINRDTNMILGINCSNPYCENQLAFAEPTNISLIINTACK